MKLSIRPVDASNPIEFAGEVSGIDLGIRLSDAEVDAIHAGIDRWGVLVFHGQQIDDEQQLAFSRQLGRSNRPPATSATRASAGWRWT